jgi:hypothetical protein
MESVEQQVVHNIEIAYPSRLQEISLRFLMDNAMSQQMLLDALPSAPQLTSLKLEFSDKALQLQLDALLQLNSLRMLSWTTEAYGSNTGRPALFTDEQLRVIKRLPLQVLICNQGDWSAEEVQMLCAAPNSLQQLSELAIGGTEIDTNSLLALATLPSLNSLTVLRIRPEAYGLLSGITHLRSLSCRLDYPKPTLSEIQIFCDSLAMCSCTDLTIRKLSHSLALEFFPALVQRLPRLRALTLSKCDVMRCLDLLTDLPDLEKLTLDWCSPPVFENFKPNLPPSITHLKLLQSVSLSKKEKAEFRPPSRLFPSLQHFEYENMADDSDSDSDTGI